MLTPTVCIESKGTVRIIALNRPHRMNAFDCRQAVELRDAIQAACSDASIRTLVLTGEGDNFCTGADLKRDRAEEQRSGIDLLMVLQEAFLVLRFGGKPSICAVGGYALGAGLSIALACDFLVADRSARFGAPFTSVGLVPDLGLTQTLPERVGIGVARDMLLLGTQKTGEEAMIIGLVDDICDTGLALESALEKAVAIGKKAPLAVAATRSLLVGRRNEAETALWDELNLQRSLRLTSDVEEATVAFAERRHPIFQGR